MKIICIGDSIMQRNDWRTFPQTGWVQEMERFFSPAVQFKNFAKNGRSTKSFIDQERLSEALKFCDKGDFVFIQFGHNDEKENDPLRYTSPEKGGEFENNLIKMANAFIEKGAFPLLFTPMARRKFVGGKLCDTHGKYPEAVIEAGKKLNLPVIDMSKLTFDFLSEKGEAETRRYFMNFEKGIYENFPEGKDDNSHLRQEGAWAFSKIAAAEILKAAGKFPAYKTLADYLITDGLDEKTFEADTGDEKNFA